MAIKIIDVIHHKNKYFTQHFLIIDRMPDLLYEREKGGLLIAKDGIFCAAYKYKKPSKNWKAFAGRKFDIPMKDGSVEKAYGQWWDTGIKGYSSIGVSTIDRLNNCYVFCGYYAKTKELNEILSNFKNPSNNYKKYDNNKYNKDYLENTIKERF